MTISFPLSLPSTGPNFRTFDIEAMQAQGRATSPFTLFENVQEFTGGRWSLRASLPPMDITQAREWFGFLVSLRGGVGSFLAGDPDQTTPGGTGNGTPLVNGASQTGLTLVTDGWAFSETVLVRGDWFQLGSGGSARLHMVTADATSDGSGNATLDIWPRLRSSPANNDPLTINGAQGRFRLRASSASRLSDLAKFGVDIDAIEAL